MTMTNKDGTVVGASHHLETNTHLGMDDGGPIASPPAASRRERREALSPYRRGRGDARTPRRPTSATNDVSPVRNSLWGASLLCTRQPRELKMKSRVCRQVATF